MLSGAGDVLCGHMEGCEISTTTSTIKETIITEYHWFQFQKLIGLPDSPKLLIG